MDIASLSTALSTASLQNDVGTALLSKQLDVTETLSEGMIKAMELSVNPSVGANFDVSV